MSSANENSCFENERLTSGDTTGEERRVNDGLITLVITVNMQIVFLTELLLEVHF